MTAHSVHSVTHSTFTLERDYPAAPARVFAAWADPTAKAHWFAGPDAEHELDFRVGGRETVHGHHRESGVSLTFEATYRDVVPNERLVYASTLFAGDILSTVSITTVEFRPSDTGTRLVLTEQGTFLDGQERPDWRERGTGHQLDALGKQLADRP